MKQIFILLIMSICASQSFAQQPPAASQDSTAKKKRVTITLGTDDKGIGMSSRDSVGKVIKKSSGLSFILTFSRFDLGFTKLVDNNSFTLTPANSFLSYESWKTSNLGFDLLQFGYRFNSAFKVYLSGGFDWTNIRLKRNITILRDQPTLSYTDDAVEYDKNKFSATYLRIPLSFYFRGHDDKRGKRFQLVVGPEAGFLINGKVKQKSDENGKQKFRDDYHFTQFRYGAFARIGYGGLGLYTKYYFNDMFENSPAQSGLKNMSFGIMAGF